MIEKSRWERPVSLLAPIVTITFLISYGVLRPAHEAFYRKLGLTPEEVGLTETSMVGRSIINASVLLIAIGVIAVGFWAGFRLGRRAASSRPSRKLSEWLDTRIKSSKVFRIIFLSVGTLVALFFAYRAFSQITRPGGITAELDKIPLTTWASVGVYIVTWGVLSIFLGLGVGLGSVEKALPSWLRRLPWNTFVTAGVTIVVVCFFVQALRFWDVSAKGGEDLAAGKVPSSDFYDATGWLQIHVQPILVKSRTDPLKVCNLARYPYLVGTGIDNPMIMLFKDNSRSIIMRLPSAEYTVARGVEEPSFECGAKASMWPR